MLDLRVALLVVSPLGAIVGAMSWTDVLEGLAGIVPRRVKPLIALAFAGLMLLVPPARAAFVAFAGGWIGDTAASLSRQLTPVFTSLVTAPAAHG